MNFAELDEMELYSAKRCAIYFADRCELLEQLCRDLYQATKQYGTGLFSDRYFKQRMADLELLDGEQNA